MLKIPFSVLEFISDNVLVRIFLGKLRQKRASTARSRHIFGGDGMTVARGVLCFGNTRKGQLRQASEVASPSEDSSSDSIRHRHLTDDKSKL